MEFNPTKFYHLIRYPVYFLWSVKSMKNKHLTQHDRIIIENSLNNNLSFKAIALKVDKDCTTISKEVRNNLVPRDISCYGRVFNNCIHRSTCQKEFVCDSCKLKNPRLCRSCKFCRNDCDDFIEEVCPYLSKPPYVCNGCDNKQKCTLSKQLYYALQANRQYEERLFESRTGFVITEAEIRHLNELLVPLIRDKNQSIHHIFINHKNEIMMSEKTLYSLIDQGILEVKNIDLPRKVRYRPRRKKSMAYKVDKSCLEGRRYEDFLSFIQLHPDMAIVQMDTVEGKKGEACLLTLHFTVASFMIAIKREFNDSQSVIDFFDDIYGKLGRELFMKLFPLILTDNGTEFSNPKAIEFDKDGNRRTYIFYCHPSSPFEKGECEVNHELIRRVNPKGRTWNPYTQKDINLMMSHINSYAREKLNDKSPHLLLKTLYGEDVISIFNISCIQPDDINLTHKLISK